MRFAYGDPDELDRLACKLRSRAADVRTHASDQVRRAGSARWVSDAAEAYRNELAGRCRDADRAAAGLERAATALEAHAQEVRERLATISRIEQQVSDWFSRKAHEVKDAVEGLVRKVSDGEPQWSGWPYTPQSLPPTGDKRWLDVGEFMRRQGVL